MPQHDRAQDAHVGRAPDASTSQEDSRRANQEERQEGRAGRR
jgi:hypothetical protein